MLNNREGKLQTKTIVTGDVSQSMRRLIRSAIRRSPTLTIVRRSLHEVFYRQQSPEQTPWGFSLAGHSDMAMGNFEPAETEMVRKLLHDVEILINVGANVGYYCCHALSMNKDVVAIEPVQRNLFYLLQNIECNHCDAQVEVFPVAVGAEPGISDMWGGGTGASLIKGWASNTVHYAQKVPVLTLDRILGDTLHNKRSLILVDIEGAEFMMLEGARKTLENKPHPIWMVEITSTENQPDAVLLNPHLQDTFNEFFDRGYKAYTADLDSREIKKGHVADVVAGKASLPTYNFIFKQ